MVKYEKKKRSRGRRVMDKKERGRILAIDDEPDLTMLCKMALEHYGFEVNTFNDPKEALSNYKPGYYDLVILDIKKKDANAKVCFLTASELYYEEFRKKEYCALDKGLFIRKPIDNDELVSEVQKMIEKYS